MTEAIGSVLARALKSYGDREFDADWSAGSQFFRKQALATLTHASQEGEEAFHAFKGVCESPIECLALAALVVLLPEAKFVASKQELKDDQEWTLGVIPQMAFKGYRLDFGVLNRPTKGFFDLECDGKEFHRHNRRRDVDRNIHLWKNACIAFHVDGSALTRNPIKALEHFAKRVRGPLA